MSLHVGPVTLGLSNVTCNRAIIATTFQYIKKVCLEGLGSSILRFAPLTMERYIMGPLGTIVFIIVGSDIVTKVLVMGTLKYGNEQREQTDNEDGIMIKVYNTGIPQSCASSFVMYHEANGVVHNNRRFTQ